MKIFLENFSCKNVVKGKLFLGKSQGKGKKVLRKNEKSLRFPIFENQALHPYKNDLKVFQANDQLLSSFRVEAKNSSAASVALVNISRPK